MDGPKGGKWTVPMVDGPSKVDGPAESRWSWVKLDGLVTKSGRFRGKVDGPSESGRSV